MLYGRTDPQTPAPAGRVGSIEIRLHALERAMALFAVDAATARMRLTDLYRRGEVVAPARAGAHWVRTPAAWLCVIVERERPVVITVAPPEWELRLDERTTRDFYWLFQTSGRVGGPATPDTLVALQQHFSAH